MCILEELWKEMDTFLLHIKEYTITYKIKLLIKEDTKVLHYGHRQQQNTQILLKI